jgi:hypothetical protein
MKMDLREIGWDGMDRIQLAQYRDQRRAPVNMAMNLRVPQNVGKFLSKCRRAASQEVLISVELVVHLTEKKGTCFVLLYSRSLQVGYLTTTL